jgi:protease-4
MLRFCVALTLAVCCISPLRADEAKPAKKKVGVAHIKISGSMGERAPSVDPLFGELGETFKARIDRIRKVRNDKDVSALLLEINDISIGWGKLNELADAIASVRASGKKVYAFLESGAQSDYALAMACDEVCVPEAGWLMLSGLRMEMMFYKGLFEKIGVKADFLMMGDFKSAAEPYLRDGMSEANRKQMTALLDDFFDNELVGRIVKARSKKKLTSEQVKELIDNGPYAAKAALKAGLVDHVDYLDSYEKKIKADLGADSIEVTRDYGKKKEEDLDVFGLYRKLLFGPVKGSSSKNEKVAVIFATGAIVTGKSGASLMGGESCGSDTIIEAIRTAEKDKTVKAIVLRVDSPGGSALASDLIWKEIKNCKKPVLASMSDVAASGGYYISMGCKKIFAEPGTITGSIGVVGGKLTLRGAYDKLGLKTEVLSRGKNVGLLSNDLFTEGQKTAFRTMMEDCYDQFIDKALEGRTAAGKKITREELVKLAGGRVWTGRQAKENGLIDELGTLEDAIASAAKLGGLGKDPELLMLPKPKNSFESLLGSAFGAQLTGLDLKAIEKLGLTRHIADVSAMLELRRDPVWLMLPYRIEVK